MDEEKQNQGFLKNTGEALKQGAKNQAKKSMQKVLKKVIMVIAPILLKILIPILIVAIMVTAISNFLDGNKGETSKEANAFAVHYGGTSSEEGSSPNRIIVDANNITANGAYKLMYEFKDENGNIYADEEALEIIKSDLSVENTDLNMNNFSDSELKIIGALMYNGLQVEKYNEEELKALVIFVKADIASQNFDLRSGDEIGKEVDSNEIAENDYVYGTLQIHRTKVEETSNGEIKYIEETLEYVSYEEFSNMVEQKPLDAINKFSIDDEGNLVIAKWSKTAVVDENGNEISSETFITTTPINYKQNISEYTANYGFLSDLLIVTNNVDFCLELAEIAFNSKIVINIKEELTITDTTRTVTTTTTTLLYKYVDYEVTVGGDVVETGESHLIEGNEDDAIESPLIDGNEDDTIESPYTEMTTTSNTTVTRTIDQNNRYSFEISEIDCWYADYKKEYNSPEKKPSYERSEETEPGKYPEEATERAKMNEDSNVLEFINEKYESYSDTENIECTVDDFTVLEKSKTDSVEIIESTSITYEFGEEIADTTEIKLKNVEYVNNQQMFTSENQEGETEIGFLYIYDKYRQAGVDLYLENDSEKKLFDLLEKTSETSNIDNTSISRVIRGLLYIYDGIDRGVTELKLTIIDLNSMNSIKGSSIENYIKAWANRELWLYETGQTIVFPTSYLTEDEASYFVYENNIGYIREYDTLKTIFPELENIVENLSIGDTVDKSSIDAVFQNTILPYYETYVEEYLATNLPEYEFTKVQKDALISISYQYGDISGFAEAYENCKQIDGTIDTEKLKTEYDRFDYSGRVDDINYANYYLFTEEKYIDSEGNEITSLGGDIVSMAKTIHDYMSKNSYYYCLKGREESKAAHTRAGIINCGLATSFEASKIPGNDGYRLTCCATYVSWVLEELGYIETHVDGCSLLIDEIEELQGWKIIDNYDELEAGDIVFMDTEDVNDGKITHVQIYVGDGCWYNAGDNDSIHALEPQQYSVRNKFVKAYRLP